MKKKIELLIILFILLGGTIWFHFNLKENNEFEKIYIKFIDNVIIEYGDTIHAKDFIESYYGEDLECGNIDTSSVGNKTTTYKIKYHNKVKEFHLNYQIVDTNKPLITFVNDKVEIKINESLQVSKYIKEVSDIIDGQIEYKENPTDQDVNYYTFISNVENTKVGTYSVEIKAVDKNNNSSYKTIVIVVKENEQTNVTLPSYNPNFVINKNKVIVINAGHQSKGDSTKEAIGPNATTMKAKVSSGATGVKSKVKESQINLDVALKLKDELESRGYTVYMTRTTQNVNLSNQQRALIANSYNPAAVISIHCDGSDNQSVSGAHTISIKKDNPYCSILYDASSKLAIDIINEYCKETGIKNRGVSYRNDLTGLNWSTVPAIYLELGFLSNEQEDALLTDSIFQNKCVIGIANGIDKYLK